jgi:hypothetical protein
MTFRIISLLLLAPVVFWYFRSVPNTLQIKKPLPAADLFARLYRYGFAGILLMFISGFTHILVFGVPISGLLLLLHLTVAPFLALLAATMIALGAPKNILYDKSETAGCDKITAASKIVFWTISFLTLPALLSPLLTMFPYFSEETGELMLTLHRYCALLLFVLILIYDSLIIRINSRPELYNKQ